MKDLKRILWLVSVTCIFALIAAGCGGGGGDGDGGNVTAQSVEEGVFLDSAVDGIQYVTATGSGVTSAGGKFSYMAGETVTFSIGDITLGQTQAATSITPVDLVPGAVDETNPTVTNICRLLISLDVNGDSSDGITISSEIRSEAQGMSIDFAMSAIAFGNDADVQAFFDRLNIMGVFTADTPRDLCSANEAQSHLELTLLGRLAGTYEGTHSGDAYGTWSVTVTCDGTVTGTAFNGANGAQTGVWGTALSSGDVTLTTGGTGTGSTWVGTLDHLSGNVTGTWEDAAWNENGTFSGSQTIAQDCG